MRAREADAGAALPFERAEHPHSRNPPTLLAAY